MYLFIVLGTMLVLPIASVAIETVLLGTSPNIIHIFENWFIFWALGVRLFVAGFRQIVQPSFTAKQIFEIEDSKAHVVVQELGFANVAFGILGLVTIFQPHWISSATLCGFVFYGLAGANHIFKKKNKTEWIAMVSDLYAAILFGIFLSFNLLKP